VSTQPSERGDTGSKLERRYWRLLALYPRDHRTRHGEEMLGVLMAGAGERTRPGVGETIDLLWAALRLHTRRMVTADGIDHRDVLAVVSLLGPVAILAGATTGLHELAWWVKDGLVSGLSEMPWLEQFPDAPVWLVWLAVATLVVLRKQRIAAIGAWLGVAGFCWLLFFAPAQHWWYAKDAGWVELGVVTAVALTWSPGVGRGRELVGRRGIVVMATAVVATVLCGVFGYRENVAEFLVVALPVVGAVMACAPGSRTGRRAALVLSLPTVSIVLWLLLMPGKVLDVDLPYAPREVLMAVIYFGVPLVLSLAFGALPRRVRPRRDRPVV
jgi:hypothetical protein